MTQFPEIWLAQLNPTVGDVSGNVQQMLSAIQKAKSSSNNAASTLRIIVFSELIVSGYPPKDLLLRSDFIAHCVAANEAIAAASDDNTIIIWGNIQRNTSGIGMPLYNTALVAHRGKQIGEVIKHNLVNYDVFDEARYFQPGPVSKGLLKLTLDNGQKLAVCICEISGLTRHSKTKTRA